jgi:hypothetical protein
MMLLLVVGKEAILLKQVSQVDRPKDKTLLPLALGAYQGFPCPFLLLALIGFFYPDVEEDLLIGFDEELLPQIVELPLADPVRHYLGVGL